MSDSITLPTAPRPTVGVTGIHAPLFADYYDYFQTAYKNIYGADTYLAEDSEDGEWLGIVSTALSDQAAAAIAAYMSYSPTTAQGAGLSSVVKTNGIARNVPSASTVDVVIVGVAGRVINLGVVGDGTNRWSLPAVVTIPGGGEITVTATCQAQGAIQAVPGVVDQILTPTAGWQSVNNLSSATPGQPIETDAQLRVRQTQSTALPSRTVLDGIMGSVAAVPGVLRYRPYENDTNVTDGNGIPAHSISLVVDGGDAMAIASLIALKKTPGAGTFGTTTEIVPDQNGIPHEINFFRPTGVAIEVELNIHNLEGYTSIVGDEIKQAVVDYINSLPIGQSVLYTRLYVPAQLMGPYASPASPLDPGTFELVSVLISRDGDPVAAADVVIDFNEAAFAVLADITLNVA